MIQHPAIKNRCGWTPTAAPHSSCLLFLFGGHLLLKPALTLDFVNVCSHGYLSLCQLLLAALNLQVSGSPPACPRTHRSDSGLAETFVWYIWQRKCSLMECCCRRRACLAELDPILCKNFSINRSSRCYLWPEHKMTQTWDNVDVKTAEKWQNIWVNTHSNIAEGGVKPSAS